MNYELITVLVGIFTALSGFVFAYFTLKRNDKAEHESKGKAEGVIISDIGYIKSCIDRVERNLNTVDERYRNIAERLAKLEEGLANVIKRVDEIG